MTGTNDFVSNRAKKEGIAALPQKVQHLLDSYIDFEILRVRRDPAKEIPAHILQATEDRMNAIKSEIDQLCTDKGLIYKDVIALADKEVIQRASEGVAHR